MPSSCTCSCRSDPTLGRSVHAHRMCSVYIECVLYIACVVSTYIYAYITYGRRSGPRYACILLLIWHACILLLIWHACILLLIWQAIRTAICEALNRHKNEKTKEILKTTYFDSHVIMLQETASSFVDDLRSDKQISAKYLVISPNGASSTQRDQNSLILLGKPELNQTLNLN